MQRFWRGLTALAAVGLVAGLAASARGPLLKPVSAAPGTSITDPGRPVPAVAVRLFQFKPAPLEVKAGTQVTWTNQDDILHTVTSGMPERRDGRFDAALDGKESTYRFTFQQPGTYPYFCDRHQSMRGEIIVR
jgi:hypothetical protein